MIKNKLFQLLMIASCCLSLQVFSLENSLSPDLSGIKDPTKLIPDEIDRLDDLILATQQSLDTQKKLKEHILEYQRVQTLYLKNTENNDLLFQLVKSAYRTLKSIQENHLTQTFDSEFISELTMLSKIATKRGVPKP